MGGFKSKFNKHQKTVDGIKTHFKEQREEKTRELVDIQKAEELERQKEQEALKIRKEKIFAGSPSLGPLVYEDLPENSRIKHEIDRYRKQNEENLKIKSQLEKAAKEQGQKEAQDNFEK